MRGDRATAEHHSGITNRSRLAWRIMTTVHAVDSTDHDELPNPLLTEHADCATCEQGGHCSRRAAEFRNYARLATDRLRRLRTEITQLHVEARLVPLDRRTPHPASRRGWAVRAGDPF